MSNDNRIWILFARKLSNEATTSELAELEKLLQDSADIQETIKLLSVFWKQNKQTETVEEGLVRKMLKDFLNEK